MADGPTAELGSIAPSHISSSISGVPSWSQLGWRETEHVPAMQWPESVMTVLQMLTDAQVSALLSAIWFPVRSRRVAIDPNGFDEAACRKLAADLDLPLKGETETQSKGRRRGAFNHRVHFERTLSGTAFGHALFNIVGEYDADGMWRLKKLAPRPAWTLDNWWIDKQGEPTQVDQLQTDPKTEIPRSKFALWTWGGDGDPRGQSILRPLYKPWVLKDRAMRLDIVAHERNSMGIPVGFTAEGSDESERDLMLEQLAGLAAGEETALVFPHGTDVKLKGVEGATTKVMESIKFYNDEMARATLGMVIQAGQTYSSTRSSDNFYDLLELFHDNVIQWYCDGLTAEVVEPWVDFNFGNDVDAPRVIWEDATVGAAGSPATGTSPANPAPAQSTTPEPAGPGAQPDPQGTANAAHHHHHRGGKLPSGKTRKYARTFAGSAQKRAFAANMPDNPRRDPFAFEVAASVDFKSMQATQSNATDALTKQLTDIRGYLTDVVADALKEVGDLAADADQVAIVNAATDSAIAAWIADSEDEVVKLSAAIEAANGKGAAQAVQEASKQGQTITAQDGKYAARAESEARDLINRMAQQVKNGASTAARTSIGTVGNGATVSTAVVGFMDKLSDAEPLKAAGGAIARAILSGRAETMREAKPTSVYSSELMDSSTCEACEEVDGTEYDSMEDAMNDYPAGGFLGCLGLESCRGTLVATYD